MLIILVVIYYIFLRYSPEQIITYSGYAIEGKEMVENLKSSDKSKLAPYLGLIAVQENDLIYKKLNSYYIGEDDKKEIDINYPIYINEGNALLNLGKNTKLITVNYEEVEGYPDFMMADGVMYNGIDLTRADGNKYLFLKSEDEIYTNVEPITITTANGEYTIREFSNIYFAEDHIAYYEMEGMQEENEQTDKNEEKNSSINSQGNKQNDNLKDSYLQYKEINPIDPDSKAKINGETITYKTLLERLEILQTEESNTNNNNEENATNETKKDDVKNTTNEENTTVEETTGATNGSNNQNITNTENNNSNKDEDEWQEGMWEKPEVSCTDFESDVYTISTNLSVRDRANVISRGITFELYLDGRLNRRVFATKVGKVEISNLQPSSEYEIKGIFYYTDENGVEQQEEFYNGKVTTKSIDTLGTIDFSFQNGEIYSNKIELIHLKINNNRDEEVIKGISRLQVEIGDVAYRLSNNQVNDIKAGKEITYQTSESLTSNSKIKYKITAYDRFGNELKEKNNEGETITSKQMPTASIRPTKQDVTEIEIEVVLNNKDNVKLENYRYEITNPSGDIVKQGMLGTGSGSNNGQIGEDGSLIAGETINDGHKETLKFNDLDPNGYYQIVIYGDYNLEDGTGVKQNAELGRGSFVTRPLASLGYMQVKIDDKEITQNSMNLGISIDANQTDARLLAILDKVEVVIYDQGKNSDQINQGQEEQSKETEIQRITLTKEQVEQLKVAEEVELSLQQLNSNTKYRIDVITTVKQGTVEEVVEDKQNIEQLITLKMSAEVQIKNQFVIGTMIDLDMRIEDIDNAVLTNKVRIEVRDKDNKLIDLSEMQTNAEYERKTYEDLTPNEEYRIIVYAPQYNIGSTDETYEADYVLKEIKIVTETGISGKLDLIGLAKTPTGKNLVDVSSKVNWYEKCFDTSGNYGLSYNEESKILTLGGTTWPNNITYYDLSKYLGQEITISFKAKSDNAKNLNIIEKKNDDFNNADVTTYYWIKDLNNEWQEYNYTTILKTTGYIGFYVDANTLVEIQDLQIELGSKKTDYEEFKYEYNANIVVTVNDERDEIATNDYYIRIYKNNEQIQELRYEEIGENNKVENAQKTYNIEPDVNYNIELLVKIGERYYELDSQEFTTEGAKEIKGIFNLNDYLKIQPFGSYIILNDLDMQNSSSKYTFGAFTEKSGFSGTIDYNGKKIYINSKDNLGRLFRRIKKNGTIKNLVFDINFDNTSDVSEFISLVGYNYGKMENIQINMWQSSKGTVGLYKILCDYNYGVVENFIINVENDINVLGSSQVCLILRNNFGTVKNGYIYGHDINVTETNNRDKNLGIESNQANATISNIFTLTNINYLDSLSDNNTANIVLNNNNNATVQNVYSVGIGKNTTYLTHGPNVYNKGSKKVYNNYYFADEIFTSELETKGNMLSLWDSTFQNQIINQDGAFIVDELVNKGFYPQLNMPECMPAQEYIELPEVKDADLPDILSTKVLEQGTNTVKVEFSVNNPSSETINNIQIENIETEILSQEYSNGKSTVIAELKNPIICVSSYNVLSISTKGAYGSTYKREYEKGERVINVDLYKEIWNVTDWKAIADSPTENYMLMEDLNFINEGNSIHISEIRGILNGNGHTVSNIHLNNGAPLFYMVYGTLKDMYIKNYIQEGKITHGGIIAGLASGRIDGVHVTNAEVNSQENTGTVMIGALIGDCWNSSVTNCSVNNSSVNVNMETGTLYLGGAIGQVRNTTIDCCYTYNISMNDSNVTNARIGGIIGGGSYNKITNCYSGGKIVSKNINVGGILGLSGAEVEIENCYSTVNISTNNINLGGIIGRSTAVDTEGIVNNLSIGKIYTTSGIESINRIIGSTTNTTDNNYAYEKQLLNGYASEEEKGATLLTKEEVLNLNLGESFNYDKKGEGILPKLYNTEGTELLPNQQDIFLDDSKETENANLEIESIETAKPNTTEAEITVKIKNPEEIEITDLEIEDMEVAEVTRNVTQNGITSITVRATPIRYFDNYKLTAIKYKMDSKEEQSKEIELEIPVQFYKEIYTYEDWQSIEEGTYQNYKLMADIDFTGKPSIKNNIKVNRLEAENKIYTLKNIKLEFSDANTGLINNVKTRIKNIGFENIILTNIASTGNYFGIISTNGGIIDNVKFSNITIEAQKMNYVGIVGSFVFGEVTNVEMENINVNGNSYIGGLAGECNYNVNNVKAKDIHVTAVDNYAGGIMGITTGPTRKSNLSRKY